MSTLANSGDRMLKEKKLLGVFSCLLFFVASCASDKEEQNTPVECSEAERIAKEADPLGLLIKVANGVRFEAAAEPGDAKRTHVFPTLEQRIHAAQTLAKKVIPDMKAVAVTGEDGEPFVFQFVQLPNA